MISLSAEEIRAWLLTELASRLGRDVRDLDPKRRFQDLGLDSAGAVAWTARLSERLGRPLSPTLVWALPTPESLARHLAGEPPGREEAGGADAIGTGAEPVAVIGLACRFPGAADVEAFWRLLTSATDAVGEVPKSRWEIDAYYSADARAPGKMSTRQAGFLEAVDRFDAGFFGLSPRQARQLDPQQRLLLELVWEAMEDAGLVAERLRGRRAGVFVGARESEYTRLVGLAAVDPHTATGQDTSVLSGRVSYVFGFEGPSLTLNTACSSSLVAVHLACQSLARGESSVAFAGGVQLMIHPWGTVALSKLGGLSPDGRCKAFDARADGFGRGEGGGVVVLKPLSQALADGDPVYCTLRGSAVNNDGFSNGLTAPSAAAQEAMLRAAYRNAGVDGAAVHYVEAHGTGTALGDPIEARALGAVLGAGRAPDRPLSIGSVKTNLGHLEAAAGIAGLIKVALALRHRRLPPSLHFETPNPHIPFRDLGLAVQTALEPWPHPGEEAVAGVNAFGFSGTNCHLVVSAPRRPEPPRPRQSAGRRSAGRRLVFVFSGNGCQWPGMARELLSEPAFYHRAARCDEAFRGLLPFSLLELLGAPEGAPEAARWLDGAQMGDEAGQLALFATQLGLVDLWRSWGVEPEAVVGHSDSEAAAAHVAGALDFEDAARVIYQCARVQKRLAGRGGMLLVALSRAEVERDLADLAGGGLEGAGVAAVNSPRSTAVSGPHPALAALAARWNERGVECRPIKVDIAAHGVHLEALRDELTAVLADLRPGAAALPIVSTVDGDRADGAGFDGAYWASNLRQPVLFAPAIETLLSEGFDHFLEISPHPILARPLLEILGDRGRVLPSIERSRPAHAALFESLAALGDLGWDVRATPAAGPDLCEPAGRTARREEGPELVVLSAHEPRALVDLAGATRRFLASRPDVSLRELAYQRAVKRSHLEHRLAVVAASRRGLEEQLEAFASGAPPAAAAHGRRLPGRPPRVVWVFPGQGGQWPGMGRRLLEVSGDFRRQLAECDAAISRHLDPPGSWSVLEEVRRGPRTDIDVIQPVLFALQVALAGTLRAWGLEPGAVVGHSMGEAAAACVAGALSLDDAAAVICRRSRLLRGACGRGAMLVTECTPEQAAEVLAGEEERVALAAVNGPRTSVLSGDREALGRIAAKLEGRGVFHRFVQVDVASHSPQVAPLGEAVRSALEHLRPRTAEVPFHSTVSGRRADGRELGAEYWVRNLRRPVRFWPVVERLAAAGFDTFLEIGPHPVLVPALENALARHGIPATALGTLRRDEDDRTSVLRTVAALYAAGCDVDWRRLQPAAGRHLRLPLYPWQRRRFWIEAPAQPRAPRRAAAGPHPFVGPAFESSLHPGTLHWQGELRLRDFPELADHRVDLEGAAGEKPVVLAAGHQLELVISAAAEIAPPRTLAVEDVSFREALVLNSDEAARLQLAVGPDGDGAWRFQIASRRGDGWTVHTTGRVVSAARRAPSTLEPETGPRPGTERDGTPRTRDEHLAALKRRGIDCGPSLRAVATLRRRPGEATAELRLPASSGGRGAVALVDAGFQLLVAALPEESDRAGEGFTIASPSAADAYLSPGLDRLWLAPELAGTDRPLRAAARLRPAGEADGAGFAGEVSIWDDAGRTVLRGEGLRLRRVVPAARREVTQDLFEIRWREAALTAAERAGGAAGSWLLVADRGGVARRLGSRLEARGATCRIAPAGAQADEVRDALAEMRDAGRPCRGVVLLSGLDLGGDAEPFSEAAQRDGWESVLGLVRTLAGDADAQLPAGSEAPRLWVITRGAWPAGGARGVDLASSFVAGLLAVAAVEHRELRPTLVDLPAGDTEVEALAHELLADSAAERVALRGDRRFLPRAERIRPAAAKGRSDGRPASPSGTWLVTGGLGALGLAVARDLAEQGARHLFLIGRSAPGAAARTVLAELESAGVTVRTARVDVSDANALAAALAEVRRDLPALGGIVHAASVIDDGRLRRLDPEGFRAVLAPKAAGAWNLHRLTRDQPLEAFVLFSSVASVLGLPGQGSYAAANAFLDALAHHRRSRGLPAVSIDWPGWAGLGLAATAGGRRILGYLERRGVGELAGVQGLAVLRRVLRAETLPAQLLVLPLEDGGSVRPDHHGPRPRLWETLFGERPGAELPAAGVPAGGELREELLGVPPGPRRRALLENRLREEVGRVLGLEPERIDPHRPWRELGLESLMAVELRGRLESLTGLTLSTTLVWRKPSLRELIPFLAEKMGMAPEAPAAPDKAAAGAVGEAELAALVAEVESLSDEESRRLLG